MSSDKNGASSVNVFGRTMRRSTVLKATLGAVGGGALLGGGAFAYASNGTGPAKQDNAELTVTKIADLTGNENSTKFGVGGTDLGIPVETPEGQRLFIFGDTYEGPAPDENDPNWRSPIGFFSTTEDLNSGLVWDKAIGGETARQLWEYEHNNGEFSTVLPSDVITIGDTMYLQVMVHESLGKVLRQEIWQSSDEGETWTDTGARWDGEQYEGRMQLWTWAAGDDGYVYVYSTRFDRTRGIILHRVPAESITDSSAYEWWGWDGENWDWMLGDVAEVWTKATGEMCLRPMEGKWLLTFFNEGDYSIDGIILDSPTDDLNAATHEQLIFGADWGEEDDRNVAQLYGGYIIPGSSINDLHLMVSQWNTEENSVYHVMQHRVQGLAG